MCVCVCVCVWRGGVCKEGGGGIGGGALGGDAEAFQNSCSAVRLIICVSSHSRLSFATIVFGDVAGVISTATGVIRICA